MSPLINEEMYMNDVQSWTESLVFKDLLGSPLFFKQKH